MWLDAAAFGGEWEGWDLYVSLPGVMGRVYAGSASELGELEEVLRRFQFRALGMAEGELRERVADAVRRYDFLELMRGVL